MICIICGKKLMDFICKECGVVRTLFGWETINKISEKELEEINKKIKVKPTGGD